jgi:glycosyltransferase involved in cell wall biosynthesis
VPVIASDVGGVREMLNDGEEGLIFRNADVHHLTSILREIIENPSTIKAMKLAIRPIKIIQEDARELSGIYTFLNE